MTVWDDQFESHPVFPALEQAGQSLEASEEHLADTAQTEALARLRHVVHYTSEILGRVDPELVSRPALDTITGHLNNLTSYLQQFVASPQQSLLDNANGQADALLTQTPALLPPQTTKDVEGLQAAVSTFRRSIGQHARRADSEFGTIETKAKEHDARLAAQQEKVEAQDTRIDAAVSQFQAQFSSEQSQRQAQFSDLLEKSRSQGAETLEALKTEIEGAVSAAQIASSEATNEAKATANRELQELRTDVERRLEELDELRTKAEQAVGAIGSAVLAGGYQKASKVENRAANALRVLAVLSFMGATAIAIIAVVTGVSGDFDIESFGAKIAIGLPVIALAYYAAHESSKHREQAQLNRQLELQLSSLDAYLRELPEEERHNIKGDLADRFFESSRRAVEAVADERRSRRRANKAEEENELV